MPVAERSTTGEASPALDEGRKINAVEQALLWDELRRDPSCPSRQVMHRVALRRAPLPISVRQVNRWRVRWQCSYRKGRPRKAVAAAYERKLAAVAQGLTALNLTCRGKPIQVRLRKAPI